MICHIAHVRKFSLLRRDVLHHMRRAGYVSIKETTANNNKSNRQPPARQILEVCPLQYVFGLPRRLEPRHCTKTPEGSLRMA
jgi:hypothetical protein